MNLPIIDPRSQVREVPGAMIPDFKRYGVMWMSRTPLATALDRDGNLYCRNCDWSGQLSKIGVSSGGYALNANLTRALGGPGARSDVQTLDAYYTAAVMDALILTADVQNDITR